MKDHSGEQKPAQKSEIEMMMQEDRITSPGKEVDRDGNHVMSEE